MPKKRNMIILVSLISLLLLLSLYYTYAYKVTIEQTTGTADITYNINITDVNGTTITVPAGKTKIFDFYLKNTNGTTIKYGLAYSGTKPNTVTIAQLNTSRDPVTGTIANNVTKHISLVVVNNSSTDYTYTISPVKGYENGGDLIVPSGQTLITETYNIGPQIASEKIIALSQGDTCNENGVYQTNGHEYRYVGSNVNNWVKFNDDMYRIIGVFDDNSHGVTGEWLIKLISADTLTTTAWGTYNSSPDYTTYSNYYATWPKGSANILLNQFYLNATDISTTYGLCSDWTFYGASNNYKNKDCSKIIGYGIQTEKLRNYIQPVTWYLNGRTNAAGSSKSQFYTCERSQTTSSYCNYGSNTSDGKLYKIENVKVGLMYASDFLYATCYSHQATSSGIGYVLNNWLYNGQEWTITPYAYSTGQSGSGKSAYGIFSGESISTSGNDYGILQTGVDITAGIRPTFYLKSTIRIISGTGSFDDPYRIG